MSEAPAPPPPPPPAAPPPAPAPSGDSGSGGGVSENRSVMIVLSYLWLLALVPFLTEKDDKEVQWHAKHGLVLLAAEVLLNVVLMVVGNMIACLGCMVAGPLFLVIVGLHVVCIVKGINGERFTIPYLSDFADQF